MAVTGDELRRAMAQFATGITVVLTRDEKNEIHGMTANSFTSVSLVPPQILLCIGRQRALHGVLTRVRRFSVSILSEDQEPVSQYFAGQRETDFDQDVSYRELPGGLPGIDGALTWLEARLTVAHPGGDHDIMVAEVTSAGVAAGNGQDHEPLLFFGGNYRRIEEKRAAR